MFDILCSKFCVHHRHSSACQAPSTENNRAETRHGTDVKEDAKVGSKRVKKPVVVVGLELLLGLLLQAKGDLYWDNSFLLPFDPVRQGDGYFKGRKKSEKSCVVRRTFGRYMRCHRLLVDVISHDALQIRASGRNNADRWRVDLPTTVADDVNDHLLPAVPSSL